MLIDAIILAGGRSSRLGLVAKAEFTVDNETLLERTVRAVNAARHIVIVGPEPGPGTLSTALLETVSVTREDPPFSGPVAGIAAGLATLELLATTPSDVTVVLACDMPHISSSLAKLLRELDQNPEMDGVIAVDSAGQLQPLAAAYRTSRIMEAVAQQQQRGSLDSLPVFALLAALDLAHVPVPAGSTTDLDSWDDAKRLGARPPAQVSARKGETHERR